jgi:hypothetical protein
MPVSRRRKSQAGPDPAPAGKTGRPGSADNRAGPVMAARFFVYPAAPPVTVDPPTGTDGEKPFPES